MSMTRRGMDRLRRRYNALRRLRFAGDPMPGQWSRVPNSLLPRMKRLLRRRKGGLRLGSRSMRGGRV